MPGDEKIYDLTITNATGLSLTKFRHPPNAYAKVTLDDARKFKTKVVENTQNPSWNEHCQLTTNIISSVLCITVHHKSSVLGFTRVLGSVKIEIGYVLEQCKGGKEIDLDLVPHDSGQIKIALTAPESNLAADTALTDARKAAENIGIGRAQKATEAISSVQNQISSQSGTFDALGTVLSKIDIFIKVVDKVANVHPYAQLAWQIVSSVYRVFRSQVTTDEKLMELVAVMANVMSFVDAIQTDVRGKVEVLENTIKRIFMQTVECAIFIREYANHGFAVRTAFGVVQDYAGTIERLSRSLLDLKRDFDSSVAVQTVIVTFRTQWDVAKILTSQTLDKLEPAKLEASGRPECLPSTRQDVLNCIVNWATDPTQNQNVLWLHGMAGLGKSTLSTTVASYFRDLGRLGAFIFFDRGFPEMSHPSKVIRTLAYKLGSFDSRIGSAICSAIDNFPSVNDASLRTQFYKLLVDPLASLVHLRSEGPIIVVLDALDECGNLMERTQLMTVLGRELSYLPSPIRVIIASRPLEDIDVAFTNRANIVKHDLAQEANACERDIATYLDFQLGIIREKKKFKLGWPGREVIEELTKRRRKSTQPLVVSGGVWLPWRQTRQTHQTSRVRVWIRQVIV